MDLISSIPRFEIGDWWKEEDLPIDFKKFGDFLKLNVEVGFGSGEFITSFATSIKKELFVGIEVYGEGLRKVIKKIKEEKIENILPLCGDAYVITQVVFEDESLNSIFINFPDPWPKKKHKDRRLLKDEFFLLCKRKLKRKGWLYFATDDESLALFADREIKKVDGLKNCNSPNSYIHKPIYPYKTKYEKKFIEEGKKIFYFLYEKEDAPH